MTDRLTRVSGGASDIVLSPLRHAAARDPARPGLLRGCRWRGCHRQTRTGFRCTNRRQDAARQRPVAHVPGGEDPYVHGQPHAPPPISRTPQGSIRTGTARHSPGPPTLLNPPPRHPPRGAHPARGPVCSGAARGEQPVPGPAIIHSLLSAGRWGAYMPHAARLGAGVLPALRCVAAVRGTRGGRGWVPARAGAWSSTTPQAWAASVTAVWSPQQAVTVRRPFQLPEAAGRLGQVHRPGRYPHPPATALFSCSYGQVACSSE